MNKEQFKELLTFVSFMVLGIGIFFCLWSISEIFSV